MAVFRVDFNLNERRVTGNACQADVIRCAEVAKAIGNETTLIHLSTTQYVRSMSIYYIGAMIYAEMRQLVQRSAILAQESLTALWQMTLRTSLGTAVERYDDQVATLGQIVDNATHHIEVGVLQRIAVVSEGAQTDFLALTLYKRTFYAPFDACIQDALLT